MVCEGMLIAGRHQWYSWPTLPDNPRVLWKGDFQPPAKKAIANRSQGECVV